MSEKRDNSYYERQLRIKHPAIYQDYLDGKHTLAEAFRRSGLKKPRTRLHELMNAWSKATPAEQAEFLRRTGLGGGTGATGPAVVPTTIHCNLYLSSEGRGAIRRFMDDRALGKATGEVMKLLGRSPLDASLGMAMRRGTKLNASLAADLERLLRSSGYLT